MIDLVIPLGKKCGWGDYEELRYALRSAEMYVPNLGQVYIIGAKPAWLKDACHIEWPDPYRRNKDANLIQKVLRACMIPELSEKFIRMSDDQLFLAPWEPVLWYLEELGPDSFNRSPKKWYGRLKNTWESIRHITHPVYNFDSHVPMLYHKSVFPFIANRYNYGEEPGMCINTLYANHVGGDKRLMGKGLRMGVAKPKTKNQLEEEDKSGIFCNYIDRGLSNEFKSWMQHRFPESSKFEK